MGGIAGIFHMGTAKPVDPARVRAMTDAQSHRGPDGEGVWTAPGVGLGHRRLAIIDVAGGAQPMVTEDGRLAITFDGEIYNSAEVRRALEALGHAFAGHGDTEVILRGWRQWGPGVLPRLNGTFAFAIHDAAEGTLFLVRDRLGVKPLHFAELSDGSLILASELKGLLAHPLLRRAPDFTAVEDYLGLGYVPDDACIVAGVRKLAAGHWLAARRGQPPARPVLWWDVSFADRAGGGVAAREAELLERIREAVRSRMVADVPPGAFLSGEVGSSAVVAMMAEASREAVETCSIGLDEADHDEARYARIVADRFAASHRTRMVASHDFGLIDTLVRAFDEPFGDPSALQAYRLCGLARERVTVALCGDGADEAFAGHRRHAFFLAGERARALLPAQARAAIGALGDRFPDLDRAAWWLGAKATAQALGRSGNEAYALAVGVMPPTLRARLYVPDARALLGGHRAEDRYVAAMRDAPARDALDRAQYADLKIRLPGDILTKVDRTSMAVGLEAREPLLDHRLVECAARLPVSMRVRGGRGKWLMKRALRRHLPDEILHRREVGFVNPTGAWFRGPLAAAADGIAHGSALAETGWFDASVVAGLAADHRAGRADHGRLLWQLLMLDRSLTRLFGIGHARAG